MMNNPAESAMHLNQSFWQFKYGDYSPNASLAPGHYVADVTIVGGGYTGLTAARELRRDNPDLKVMVLEAGEIGFGASGRNGGFSMTLFGMEPEVTLMRWGKEKAAEAQGYMQQAVNYVKNLVENENLDSDYEHTGMWRAAYTEAQESRLRNTFGLLCDLAEPGSYQFLERDDVQRELNSSKMRAAIYEPNTGILDPCKHVRNLKCLAEKTGVEIFENTKVTEIRRLNSGAILRTEHSVIESKKLLIATNAWSHDLVAPRKVKNRQRPVWTYQIVSDPLTQKEWDELGWQGRMSIEDNRQFVHYMRVTKCGRITMGGGNTGMNYSGAMDRWHDKKIWQNLENHFRWLFPSLAHKKIHYKWGGAVSVNLDMTPEIGFVGNEDIVYSSGCIGHGVSLTQLNGRLIADLLQENETELTRFWIVNRKAIPMPPGNFLPFVGAKSLEGIFKAIDWYEERELKRDNKVRAEGLSTKSV